ECPSELLDLDPCLEPGRVELLGRGCKEDVDACCLCEFRVALLVAWVGGEVLVRTELGRIDEEAGDDDVVLSAGRAEEREVALVEAAHCRHQADGSVACHQAAGIGVRPSSRASSKPRSRASAVPAVTAAKAPSSCSGPRARVNVWRG